MNFFGHAVVASEHSTNPAFVFGAMVPDFATMIGARPPSSPDELVVRGIACHHATDAAFHDAPTFRALHDAALAELRSLGVRRGPARAVAHIGVEILLDGRLAETRAYRDAYLAALEHGRRAPSLSWSARAAAGRCSALVGRLVEYGVGSRAPSHAIAERLDRVLAHRPRLAMNERDLATVTAWIPTAREKIEASADRAVAEVHEAMERDGYEPTRATVPLQP